MPSFPLLEAIMALSGDGGDDEYRRRGGDRPPLEPKPYLASPDAEAIQSRPSSLEPTGRESADLLDRNRVAAGSRTAAFPIQAQEVRGGRSENLPVKPEGYDHAEHMAFGRAVGGSLFDPNHPSGYYHTPEALAERDNARSHVSDHGFEVPYYMKEKAASAGGTLGSPLTNSLVNGPIGLSGDKVRDTMMWHLQNPTAQLQGGTAVYSGGSDPASPSRAELGAANRSGLTAQLVDYDKSKAQIGLAGAQGRQADASAFGTAAEVDQMPAVTAARTMQGAADMKRADVEEGRLRMEEGVLKNGGYEPPPPLPLGAYPISSDQANAVLAKSGRGALDIINNPNKQGGEDPRYFSSIMNQLQHSGYLSDPAMRPYVAAALQQQWGGEMQRIMGGGNEGVGGFFQGMAGRASPNNYFDSTQGTIEDIRRLIQSLYPNKWNFTPKPVSPSGAYVIPRKI